MSRTASAYAATRVSREDSRAFRAAEAIAKARAHPADRRLTFAARRGLLGARGRRFAYLLAVGRFDQLKEEGFE